MLQKVRQELSHMTKTEQCVAVCFLEQPTDFAFLTLDRIARQVQTSTTSVIRFCRRMGFEGYRDFQEALRRDLQSHPTLSLRLRQNSTTDSGALLGRVIDDGIRAITTTFSELPADLLERAVSVIAGAARVYVAGFRESFAPAHYTYTRLTTVRREVHLLDSAYGGMTEPILDLQTGDVCVFFLFHRYTEQAIQLLPLLQRQGATVLLVTSAPFDRVDALADLLIPCHVENQGLKNTALAPICLADYLCNALALRAPEAVDRHTGAVEELLHRAAVLGDA